MRTCRVMGSIGGYPARSGRRFQTPVSAILRDNLGDAFPDTTGVTLGNTTAI
jgi:hypothetical protein